MLSKILTVFLITIYLSVLSGCTTVQKPMVPKVVDKQGELLAATGQKEEEVEKPVSAIQSDLLYVLLASEIAGQRGQMGLALDGYLKAARLTSDARVAERAANIALFSKNNDLAMEAVAIWLVKAPNDINAHRFKAGLLMRNNQVDEALDQLDALFQLPTVNESKELGKTVQLVRENFQRKERLGFMSRFVERHEHSARFHYAYSVLAFHEKKASEAKNGLRRALELQPEMVDALKLKAQVLTKEGEIDAAIVEVKRALAVEPQNSALRMMFAGMLLANKDVDGAQEEFEEIFRDNPQNYDALFSLGLLALQQGDNKGAQEKFRRLVSNPKWAAQSAFYLGRIALQGKEYEAAVNWFSQVRSGRLSIDARMSSLSALVKLNRLPEARERLAELRMAMPARRVRLYLIEGELLSDARLYGEALDLFSEALTVLPGNLELLYARAMIAERIGRLDLMESDLLKLLAIKPDDASALNALGYTLAEQTERYEDADKYLQKAIALRPNDPAVLDSFGWLQFRTGRFEQALVYLRRAYELNNDAEIAGHLGEVLWSIGQKGEAKTIWREASERSPNSEYILELKSRFKEAF